MVLIHIWSFQKLNVKCFCSLMHASLVTNWFPCNKMLWLEKLNLNFSESMNQCTWLTWQTTLSFCQCVANFFSKWIAKLLLSIAQGLSALKTCQNLEEPCCCWTKKFFEQRLKRNVFAIGWMSIQKLFARKKMIADLELEHGMWNFQPTTNNDGHQGSWFCKSKMNFSLTLSKNQALLHQGNWKLSILFLNSRFKISTHNLTVCWSHKSFLQLFTKKMQMFQLECLCFLKFQDTTWQWQCFAFMFQIGIHTTRLWH